MKPDDELAEEHNTSSGAPSFPAPPRGEPWRLLDWEEIPDGYGEDVCGVIPRDPKRVFVYWEATDAGRAAAAAQLGPDGASARLTLRLFITVAEGTGLRRDLRDVSVEAAIGRRHIPAGPPGATVRAAIGLLAANGAFAAMATSPPARLPWDMPAPPGRVDWLEVVPGRGRSRAALFRRGSTAPGSERVWISDQGILGGASSSERPTKS
jgi:hypothetical protein